jgi:hypothetical protein
VRRFSGQLDSEVVERTVRGHVAGFADARIGDFVPVLIERRSVQDLTVMLSAKDKPPDAATETSWAGERSG